MGAQPPSFDLRRAQPPNSVNVLEINVYKNYYSVVKGYFRFKKLLRNRYFTGTKLCCLLDDSIICLSKYADLTSMFLIKLHIGKEPP